MTQRKKITMTNPMRFIDFLTDKTSNQPMKLIQKSFGMSVISAASPNGGVNVLNVLTPGKASINGEAEPVLGYLWVITASKEGETDKSKIVGAHCFMRTNDRDQFSRFFTEEQGTDPDKIYWDFVAEEGVGSNLH